MYSKVCTTTKALSTFLTFIGFHTCMNSLMLHKLGLMSEGCPTFLTFQGFLSSMCFLMSRKL
ncbi:unnamed protein product [Gulo gulo]|uniref:Uncharacterized protein n=1 Tax=Gulo gulo TaxID=48420 RepID=A0A9X9Q1Z8_GULGU|nr:unnamed protein product [Gulo gulo]